MTATPSLEAFKSAAASGERVAAWHAAIDLLAWLSDLRNEPDPPLIKSIVRTASDRRWFDMAELLAATAAGRIDATPGTRRLHVQMLMERGLSEEALSRLHSLLANPRLPVFDRGEAAGHIGRIFKDRFLAAVAARDAKEMHANLQQSLTAYLTAYKADPMSVWHGINAVALLARPEAPSVWPDAKEQATAIANQILIDAPAKADEYTPATLAEAHIALGNYRSALKWIRRYTADPAVSPFQLATFHRQLTRVWMLDREPSPGPELVSIVSATLLERENGSFQLSGADVKRDVQAPVINHEMVFGRDRFESLANYRRGLERTTCVARIGASADTGEGTGFILRGSDICEKFGDRTVLITNAHVISKERRLQDKGSLDPGDAVVTFEALPGCEGREFRPGAVLFSSPPEELDATIVELFDVPLPQVPYPLAAALPGRNSETQVRLIGHPAGRSLQFSVNKLLDHEEPKIHYRTASEGGSSGSPVFNQEWKLIGLHHAGGEAMPKLNGQSGTYEANEGLWIRAIREQACKEAVRK
jgi:hypothetical protein